MGEVWVKRRPTPETSGLPLPAFRGVGRLAAINPVPSSYTACDRPADQVGPSCVIGSDFGNLEAVLFAAGQLHHMFATVVSGNFQWSAGQTLPSVASGPGSLIQSNFGSGAHKNFEVVLWTGTDLVHYFHDNSNVALPWERAQTISTAATGSGCIIQSSFGSGPHGNFEVVVLEGNELVHYFHDNSNVALPWERAQTILSGIDGAGWIIESNFGSGAHKNFEVVVPTPEHLQHVWHDNSNVSLPWELGQAITHGSMYVFFTTNHIHDDAGDGFDSMGLSVLARSEDDGLTFGTPLFDFSSDKFINVSLQTVSGRGTAGLPSGSDGLLVWGSGGYRRSNVYLAYVPLDQIEDPTAYWYLAGVGAEPIWTHTESEAEPLFLSGSVGEVSVRWNPLLSRYVLLHNSDNPLWILERQSARPWGPWSEPQNIFDAAAAYGHYIHIAGSNDGLSDPGREADSGGVYGPYPISRYTTANPDGSTLMYFVLSVWNPYNTMLMSAIVRQVD